MQVSQDYPSIKPVERDQCIQAKSKEEGEAWETYSYLIKRVTKSIVKRQKWLGCLTADDLIQTASQGLLNGIRAPRFPNHPNKIAYLSTYCRGYCLHLIARKSRMIRPSDLALKLKAEDLGHQSIEDFDNYASKSHYDGDLLTMPDDFLDFIEAFSPREMLDYDSKGAVPTRLTLEYNSLINKYNV